MLRLLRYSLLIIFVTSFTGCKNKFKYPKDLKTGVYEVSALYKYPNDSNVTETLNYLGPQKDQSSLIFTYSDNGFSKTFWIREVEGDTPTIRFQISDLNSGNTSLVNCSFETIEHKKNFLNIKFQMTSQQGVSGFESGELTLKKVQ